MGYFRRSNRGFTLVEIMIVVAIIALLAAIAIPNMLRARHNANETAAIAAMRTISTALESFRANQTPTAYPVALLTLGPAGSNPPYIDPVLASGLKQGYRFTYFRVSNDLFTLSSVPTAFRTTGTRGFYVDQTGVIRVNPVGPAGPGSVPLE
jgi:prepilin-type N-terminal cleavage/methylation domain-containing protein